MDSWSKQEIDDYCKPLPVPGSRYFEDIHKRLSEKRDESANKLLRVGLSDDDIDLSLIKAETTYSVEEIERMASIKDSEFMNEDHRLNEIAYVERKSLEQALGFTVDEQQIHSIPLLQVSGKFSRKTMHGFIKIVSQNDDLYDNYILNVASFRISKADEDRFLESLRKSCVMLGNGPGVVVVLPYTIAECKAEAFGISSCKNVSDARQFIEYWERIHE